MNDRPDVKPAAFKGAAGETTALWRESAREAAALRQRTIEWMDQVVKVLTVRRDAADKLVPVVSAETAQNVPNDVLIAVATNQVLLPVDRYGYLGDQPSKPSSVVRLLGRWAGEELARRRVQTPAVSVSTTRAYLGQVDFHKV